MTGEARANRNVALFPWFRFLQNLLFWQAVWFLYFQSELSAAEAILLYAVYDIATTVLEVPSGYMSDRLGRRVTLAASALAGLVGAALIGVGEGFWMFAIGQVLLGANVAFSSGTDSALLFESLVGAGREDEIEREELRAWRYSFVGLAISAVLGGGLAMIGGTLPFLAGAAAFGVALLVGLGFHEPTNRGSEVSTGAELVRFRSLRTSMGEPVLIWLFVIAVLMYVFSHILFVFGQPFILQALADSGLREDVPLVSGTVSAAMLFLSVVASLYAPALRVRLGLPRLLLIALAMQIALSGVLALTDAVIAIAALFLRMVPTSLSRPFILARIQPLLQNDSRATYLSLQSLASRLILSATFLIVAFAMPERGQLDHPEIRQILTWYVGTGVVFLAALVFAARRLPIEKSD